MLYIQRRIDINPCLQQFFNILAAFSVAGAARVFMRELVDQEKPWAALQTGIHVKLINGLPRLRKRFERQRLKAIRQDLRLRPLTAGEQADGNILSSPHGAAGSLQHPVGLSRAGEITGKNRKGSFPPPLSPSDLRRSLHITASLQTALL